MTRSAPETLDLGQPRDRAPRHRLQRAGSVFRGLCSLARRSLHHGWHRCTRIKWQITSSLSAQIREIRGPKSVGSIVFGSWRPARKTRARLAWGDRIIEELDSGKVRGFPGRGSEYSCPASPHLLLTGGNGKQREGCPALTQRSLLPPITQQPVARLQVDYGMFAVCGAPLRDTTTQ